MQSDHYRISKVMIRALRDFSRTGVITGTQATKDALVSMRYLRATLRESEVVFDYTLTIRGKSLLQEVPEELTKDKPVRVGLPIITCVPGCGDCCGPVPITAMELHRLKAYVEKYQVAPKYTGYLTCPFFQGGSCKVHAVRPLLCQLFGHTRKMKCPKSRNRFVPEKVIHQMMIENGTAIGTIPQFFRVASSELDSHTQEQPSPQAEPLKILEYTVCLKVQHTVYSGHMDIQDLPKVSYTIAVEHGWWEEERPLVDLIMLMVSEVAEAIEDYRKNHEPNEMWFEVKDSEGNVYTSPKGTPGDKPCGIPSELADLVIRVGDLFGYLEDPIRKVPYDIDPTTGYFPQSLTKGQPLTGTFMEGLYKATLCVVLALDDHNGVIQPKYGIKGCLRNAVRCTFSLAQQFDIDLMQAVELKTAYNRTRPYKHGNKRI